MNKEQIEGNKIIAEFMGGFYVKSEYDDNDDLVEVYDMSFDMDRTSLHGLTQNKNKGRKFVKKIRISHLQYHSSWDWLMPVVEKINKTYASQLNNYDYNRGEDASHSFVILLPSGQYWNNCPEGGSPDRIWGKSNSMIEAVWLAVVKFLNWYNQNRML